MEVPDCRHGMAHQSQVFLTERRRIYSPVGREEVRLKDKPLLLPHRGPRGSDWSHLRGDQLRIHQLQDLLKVFLKKVGSERSQGSPGFRVNQRRDSVV